MECMKDNCIFADSCRKAGSDVCNSTCYPFVLAHGINADSGFLKASGIPAKYKNSFLHNLPIRKENPEAYAVANAYIKDILNFVEKGVGLFLYSVPNERNRLGTGTGKTTTATAIGNEYLKARMMQHVKREKNINVQPTVYIRVAEFQNTYNKQFRGTQEEQAEATAKLSKMLKRMNEAELLILDDISLRSSTEALSNLIYEVIDERYIQEKPVIFTSNFPLEKIGELLLPQIQSRIDGMTEQIAFKGKDFRKGGIL